MSKRRDFILISHCLINPHCRVHILGKNYPFSKKLCCTLLSNNISMIQLPCPEFMIMGYIRNPQGRQQYNNVFFRNHCRKIIKPYMMEVEELTLNKHRLVGYIGVQGSPTCSIYWGKHKKNKYNTESIMLNTKENQLGCVYNNFGVLTQIVVEELARLNLDVPILEAPIKEHLTSELSKSFFINLENILL